jgi:hypothetical protein
MDADSSATTSIYDLFERLLIPIALRSNKNLDKEKIPILIRKQYIAGIFISLIYLDALTTNYFPKTHPIGYARFLTASGVLDILFNKYQPESIPLIEEVRLNLANCFIALSGDINFLQHPIATNVAIYEDDLENPTHVYSSLGVASGLNHLAPLHGRWARVRPYLEKFHRGGRLAPAGAPPY